MWNSLTYRYFEELLNSESEDDFAISGDYSNNDVTESDSRDESNSDSNDCDISTSTAQKKQKVSEMAMESHLLIQSKTNDITM
jgi:hypothetical protein